MKLRLRRYLRRAGRGRSADLDLPIDAEQALEAAEDLVAHERFADAVRLLTETNRRCRNAQVEKRIVDIRFDAIKKTDWRIERPLLPVKVEDLFSGERIPEVPRESLTVDRLRSGIMNHGSMIVRGLVAPVQVKQLVDDIDKALTAFDAQAEGLRFSDVDGWYEPFAQNRSSNRTLKRKRGAVLAVESPPALFDLIEIFEDRGVGSLARDYFGELPMLLAKKVVLRRMSREGHTGGWHQDGAFMGPGIRSLNVWLALSRCGDVAPGLDVVSRRLDDLVQMGDGAFAEWGVKPHVAEHAAKGAIVRPIFDPGDALLLDHLTLHRTAVDVGMKNDRYAIETWLFAPSTYDSMTAKTVHAYQPRDQLPILY